jgi:hypothetical protein
MAMEIDLSLLESIGGYERSAGDGSGEKIYNFGWLVPEDRSAEQQNYHAILSQQLYLTAMPDRGKLDRPIQLPQSGDNSILISDDSRTFLWDYVRPWNPELKFIRQILGTCVGAGGGGMLITRMSVDKYALGEAEEPCIPLWLPGYAKSRQYCNIRGPGGGRNDGSTGTTWARSLNIDGYLRMTDHAAVFPFSDTNNYAHSAAIEAKFSDYRAYSMEIWEASKQHTALLTKLVTDVDELIEHIRVHKRPFTCASNWGGYNPGEDVPIAGSRFPVRLNKRVSKWQHQMSGHAHWRHPELNDDLFFLLNQWGRGIHGKPMHGEPPGGFWITRNDMKYILKQKEVFVYDSLRGMAADLDFSTV